MVRDPLTLAASSPAKRPTPKQLVVAVGAAFVALDVLNFFAGSLPGPLDLIFSALVGVQIWLAVIWLVFGWSRLRLRVLTAIGLLLLAESASFYQMADEIGWSLVDFVLFAHLALLVALLSVPAGIARAYGWRVRQFTDPEAMTAWQTDRRPIQFTLRQLFLWTTILALAGGLSRWLEKPLSKFFPIGNMALSLIYGALLLAILGAALGRKRHFLRLGWCMLAAGCLGQAILFSECWNYPELRSLISTSKIWFAGLAYPLRIALVGGVLLLFRAQQFRFMRVRADDAPLRRRD